MCDTTLVCIRLIYLLQGVPSEREFAHNGLNGLVVDAERLSGRGHLRAHGRRRFRRVRRFINWEIQP